MAHQSYRDVFVTNNPALLGSGLFTNDLAVGQLGLFLVDPTKDQKSVSAPNYSQHRTIQLVQGTPELPTNLLAAVANQSKRSKPIKGRKILSFTGRKAERGQNQRIAIGFDGVDTTKTIKAKCEESKTVFVKLSGGPIDQIFHTEGKGIVTQYSLFSGCCDDCGDNCADVSAETMADDLIRQINADPILSLGTRTGNKVIRAKKVLGSGSPVADSTGEEYQLSIADDGSDTALGRVQSQYPGKVVTRISRTGVTSVYSFVQPSAAAAPADFTNAGLSIISDCPACPAGFTALAAGFAYKVERQDAGNGAALTQLNTDYGIASANESSARVSYEYGQSTYIIVSATAVGAAVGTDILIALGKTRNSCLLSAPTTTAWVLSATVYNSFNKTFKITLNDSVCGTSRLADLQAAFPALVIAEASAGACVRSYTTTVASDFVPAGCPPDAPTWVAPDAFEGITWVRVDAAPADTQVGVILESAFVDRVTGEAAFDHWSYDAEPIFIEVSQHSQDYNDKPTICSTEWPVTEIQGAKIAIGVGSKVREEEAFFKGYERKYRDECNPIVRELQDAVLQTDPNAFYDQYTLEFEFDFHQAWFSEKLTDTYRLEVYFKEGQGKAFEAAVNGYLASVGVDVDPVVL